MKMEMMKQHADSNADTTDTPSCNKTSATMADIHLDEMATMITTLTTTNNENTTTKTLDSLDQISTEKSAASTAASTFASPQPTTVDSAPSLSRMTPTNISLPEIECIRATEVENKVCPREQAKNQSFEKQSRFVNIKEKRNGLLTVQRTLPPVDKNAPKLQDKENVVVDTSSGQLLQDDSIIQNRFKDMPITVPINKIDYGIIEDTRKRKIAPVDETSLTQLFLRQFPCCGPSKVIISEVETIHEVDSCDRFLSVRSATLCKKAPFVPVLQHHDEQKQLQLQQVETENGNDATEKDASSTTMETSMSSSNTSATSRSKCGRANKKLKLAIAGARSLWASFQAPALKQKIKQRVNVSTL